VRGEGVDDHVEQRNRADTGLGPGRGEERRPVGQQDELEIHSERPAQEVPLGQRQPECLPLTQPGPGGKDDKGPVAVGNGVG